MAKNKLNFSFTLIELLITVTIIFIFSGLSLAYYNNFTQELTLKNEAKKFVDVLELARKKALSGDLSNQSCSNFNGYQIQINSSSYTLSLCCSNDCSSSTLIKNYPLSNDLKFETTATFQFLPLSAGVKQLPTNPFNICLKNEKIDKFNKIIINQSGVIEFEENLISSCS